MNLLMSDISLNVSLKDDDKYVDLSKSKISNCVGCFGCWTKTPGKCVIRDDATKVYPLIAHSEKVIYVSRLYLGSYDITMKTMLERAIPTQKAFIRLHNGETHHFQRNVVEKDAVIIAYGDISEEEQEIFQKLVERNANNMCFKNWKIYFVKEEDIEKTVIREVNKWEN